MHATYMQCVCYPGFCLRGTVSENTSSSFSIMITIPETRKSLDPDRAGAKYTMPMWIQKDVSVGEWHKTSAGTVPGQGGAGPRAERLKGWGQLWVLGAALQFQGKKVPWKQALISASHSQLSGSVSWGYITQRTASLSLPRRFISFLFPKLE